MRIALVGDYPLDPNRISGGPQAVFSYLLKGLQKIKDLELHVVAAHKSLDSPRGFRRDGVAFHYLPYPRVTTFLAFPLLQRSIHRILHQIKPDLVHGQSAHLFGSIALSAGYPSVVTAHNIHGSETRFASGRLARLNLHLQYLTTHRHFVSRARHVVSISPYIRNHYEPYVNATFYDIDNPIDDSFFDLDPGRERPNQILFVGLLRPRKRPDLALEALVLARRKAPDLSLQFAGAAVDPVLDVKLRALVARHNLDGNVRFLGHLSESQLLEAYHQMSILLLTSDLETSPMAVEQAMAAGKPVVATSVGGVPYLVDNGRTGIVVEPNRPEPIAQALVTLAQDAQLRKRIGRAAREEALSRFKAEVVAVKTHEMYRRILEEG